MKKLLIMIAAVICTVVTAANGLVLAKDGKALYTIVERANAARLEKASVKDLKWHLDKITGGDFKIGTADSKRIFIGVKAPGDNEPMAKGERRLKSVNGDIYIYGEATDSAAFGIYDLLEKYCGCRWFTVWGDMKVPADANLTLPELNDRKIPPFFRFETASLGGHGKIAKVRDFLRRKRIHVTADKIAGDDDYLLGVPLHTFCKYLPPGNVPMGTFVNNIGSAYKYFADKKYFETNPEWFTLDKSGKRVNHRQLCLSNRELRKEFLKNLEIVIKNEYKGGDAVIVVDMNDRPDYICCCGNCKALEKKYATPGGPLYDYLIELGGIFAKKYPRITLRALAYGCSLIPPNCDLPENVMMWYAPLGLLDYMKNYETSYNKTALENLQKQAIHSKALWKWMYTAPFYRGGNNAAPLIANIQRLADNLRIYHKYKVRAIMTEHGLGVCGYISFNELRLYLLGTLKEDLNQDEQAIIKEYMDFCYGKAAGKMYAFLQELEKLNAETNIAYRWLNSRPWKADYLTPKRLVRWQREFAAMEKLVADDPAALLHVKRARLALDQMILLKWPEIAKYNKKFTDKRFAAAKRKYLRDAREITGKLFADGLAPEEDIQRFRKGSLRRLNDAVKKASPKAPEQPRVIRPLPPEFAKIPADRIMRFPYLPEDGSKAPAAADGAFGFAIPGKAVAVMNFIANSDYGRAFQNPVRLSDLKKKKPAGKFHYYHLGRRKLTANGGTATVAVTTPKCKVEFDGFGNELCDADFYISIKFMPPNKIWLDELLIVKAE